MAMRADLGAPDVRYLVVVTAAEQEAALVTSERVAAVLQGLEAAGVIDGFESPAAYLPSQATQHHARPACRPRRTASAFQGPLRIAGAGGTFSHFRTMSQRRAARHLSPEDLEGTSMAKGVDALLMPSGGRWPALLPLPRRGQSSLDAERVRLHWRNGPMR